jgi:citrate lyase subunit beta / citryl-CoA lyase
MEGISGNRGPDVRSDCFVSINTKEAASIKLTLKSKVKSLFGRQIEELVLDILRYFEISKAEIFIEDSGALPYVIAARAEAAIKQLVKTDKEYLLPILHQNLYSTDRFRQRRSRLYLPGDNPKLMINAGLYGADGIILDLEDSVAPSKKHDARYLVRNALRNNDFLGAERMVRINQSPAGLDDLPFIVPHHVNLILIPKCETASDVAAVDARIGELKTDKTRNIWLMPIIESAVGIINAYEIASASPNVVALAIGLEDYTADIGAERTSEGIESLYARSVIVNAARAAGIQPIDSVFSGFDDLVTLGQVASRSKSMGFVGMGCIHPAQIPVIHESFNPSQKEIEKAKRIVWAFEEAQKKGIGVIAIGSKMIDAPVVKRALHTIDQAVRNGLLNQNWRDNYEG